MEIVKRNSGFIARISAAVRPYMPFTVLNTVIRLIDKESMRLLDVGCGRGVPMQAINRKHRYMTTGVDIFEPYLDECRALKTHDDVVACDIRTLPFDNDSFDTVICMEVLEHLDKDEGRTLVEKLESIASRQVIISTPQGEFEQGEIDANPYQFHRHIWTARELQNLGYTVRGHGWRGISGDTGIGSRVPNWLLPIINLGYILLGLIVYYLPQYSGALVAEKKITTAQSLSVISKKEGK